MSEKFHNVDYAFPLAEDDKNYRADGMSLRDYFAAKIIAAMLEGAHNINFGTSHMETNRRYAYAAYAVADAMLHVREEKS